jgi:hypothetical protein
MLEITEKTKFEIEDQIIRGLEIQKDNKEKERRLILLQITLNYKRNTIINLNEYIRLIKQEKEEYIKKNNLIKENITFLKFNEQKFIDNSKKLQEKTNELIKEVLKFKKQMMEEQSLLLESSLV